MKLFFLASFASLALVQALVQPAPGNDPADSWLAYAVARGNGKQVTLVNASWVVPSYPKQRSGGNAPGWWYGIEPNPASNLIQPILAYGYDGDAFSIFNGYFQWSNQYWWHSSQGVVKPGNTVWASVQYDQSSNSYNMWIGSHDTGFSVKSNIKIQSGKLYTDTYFVVEHQPDDCGQYPANGQITFANITIQLEGETVTPTWQVVKYQDACDCAGVVNSPSSLTFTWSTTSSSSLE